MQLSVYLVQCAGTAPVRARQLTGRHTSRPADTCGKQQQQQQQQRPRAAAAFPGSGSSKSHRCSSTCSTPAAYKAADSDKQTQLAEWLFGHSKGCVLWMLSGT